MGIFSKSAPKKKGLFATIFDTSNNSWSNKSETKDRIKWASDRSGVAAETIQEYKKKRGFNGKTDEEEVRRVLAREDSYFKYADAKDVKKALDS
jgi:hypothetical protein